MNSLKSARFSAIYLIGCFLLLCLSHTKGDCVVVSIMDQYACNFDVNGMLEAVSACAYPHFCTHVHRPENDDGNRRAQDCHKACSSLETASGGAHCGQVGCSSAVEDDTRHDKSLSQLRSLQEEEPHHWRMETHKHLHQLGLRLVRPSMCNSTKIIEEFADQTDQSFLKECMTMPVEIFTNGTFHSRRKN